jgi:RHS repeat-associated protein
VSYTKLVLHVAGHSRHAQVERALAGSDPDSLELFFHHADHLASGHVLTREDGDLLSQEEYFPYGRSSDRRDARNRYRFIGVEQDEDNHLCVTGPRTYDPVSGRFLQAEPLLMPQQSPYTYASANPLAQFDRTGLEPSTPDISEPAPEVSDDLFDYLENDYLFEPIEVDTGGLSIGDTGIDMLAADVPFVQRVSSQELSVGGNISIKGSGDFQKQVLRDLGQIMKSEDAEARLRAIMASDWEVTIQEAGIFYPSPLPYFLPSPTILLSPLSPEEAALRNSQMVPYSYSQEISVWYAPIDGIVVDAVASESFVTLGHELAHVHQFVTTPVADWSVLSKVDPRTGIKYAELQATLVENHLRAAHGLPPRPSYSGRNIDPGKPLYPYNPYQTSPSF